MLHKQCTKKQCEKCISCTCAVRDIVRKKTGFMGKICPRNWRRLSRLGIVAALISEDGDSTVEKALINVASKILAGQSL